MRPNFSTSGGRIAPSPLAASPNGDQQVPVDFPNRVLRILLAALQEFDVVLCFSVYCLYRGADKSLARPTSRYILFDG